MPQEAQLDSKQLMALSKTIVVKKFSCWKCHEISGLGINQRFCFEPLIRQRVFQWANHCLKICNFVFEVVFASSGFQFKYLSKIRTPQRG